jgi:hypothetical protein
MRYKLLAALVFISCGLQAQQVNPVPDYVFANRMSVGRNAVTDTLAYFSIGPRYGAIRGFMPPMVVDTALVTGGTKRNGLTIFSIQKNKYVYWDSVGSKWAEMAGTGGSAINSGDTASMLSPYTRGSGTANYLPKFTGTRTFSNSTIFDDGEVKINTTTDAGAFILQAAGSIYSTTGAVLAASSGGVRIGDGNAANRKLDVVGGNAIFANNGAANDASYNIVNMRAGTDATLGPLSIDFNIVPSATGTSRRANFLVGDNNAFRNLTFTVNNIGISTNSPAYKLDVNGDMRTTTSANFATTSGGVRIGDATTPGAKLSVVDNSNTYSVHFSGNGQTNGIAFGTSGANAAIIQGFTTTFLGTNDIYIQSVANSVRIGSATAPAYKLDITGDLRSTTSAYFATTSGSVGIATTSPTYKLDVNGSAYAQTLNVGRNRVDSTFLISDSVSYKILYRQLKSSLYGFNLDSTDGEYYFTTLLEGTWQQVMLFGDGTTKNIWGISSSSNSGSTFTNLVALNHNGNFGINTNAPTEKLEVNGNIKTAAPTSGSAKPWRLGEAATVSPTSPNRTIRVEIDGTVYYIHAKTTND